MAVARKAPKCPKCGESYRGLYAKRSRTFVGDSFIRWDTHGHICKLGVLYFLENMETHEWYKGKGEWTTDPHKCKLWKTKESAERFLKYSVNISARLDVQVTEHEFVHQELSLLNDLNQDPPTP